MEEFELVYLADRNCAALARLGEAAVCTNAAVAAEAICRTECIEYIAKGKRIRLRNIVVSELKKRWK